MPSGRTWIAILAIGHLTACSSIFKEISPTPSNGGEPSGRAGPFLSSPFVITVVGGLGVAAVTTLYSHFKAKTDRELAQDNARRAKQTEVLSSVANDLPVYISTMGSMRELKVWLKEHKQDDDRFGDIGLPRDEVVKQYSEFYKLTLKTRTAVPILMEVRSFYLTDRVCRLANEEDLAIKKLHDATDVEGVKEAAKAQDKAFDSLLIAMAEEVKEKPDTSDKERQPCSPQNVVHLP
jgi:hypothetical protein